MGENPIGEIIPGAEDDGADGKFDLLIAWLLLHEQRLAGLEEAARPNLEAMANESTDNSGDATPIPLNVRRSQRHLQVSKGYQSKLEQIARMIQNDPSGFIGKLRDSKPQDDVELRKFRGPRLVMISITAIYALLCVLVTAYKHPPDCEENWCLVGDWIEVIEFVWTGLAESATLADLLLTLPSREGCMWAVLHFCSYELVFLLFTATLYGRLAAEGVESWWIMVAYILIHAFKGLFVGRLLQVARNLLYDRYETKRDEMAAAYLAQLLGIMGVQVTLGGITLASFAVSNDPPNIGVLLATTTLSIALAQSFILNVCLKDASSLEPSRIATMNLYPTEWAAFFSVTLFSISMPHRGLQPRAE